jgi:PleD family two-component response regulator
MMMPDYNSAGITLSIGESPVRSDDPIGTIIKRADRFMYQYKQSRRNRLSAD